MASALSRVSIQASHSSKLSLLHGSKGILRRTPVQVFSKRFSCHFSSVTQADLKSCISKLSPQRVNCSNSKILKGNSSLGISSMFGHRKLGISTATKTAYGATRNSFSANDGSGYKVPPPEILEIVDSPPNPSLSISPQRDTLLFLHRPSLSPISELARPELKLAGVRIDPECYSQSRMSFYSGVTIYRLTDDDALVEERELKSIPEGAKINFLSWSPDGKHLAFTIRTDDPITGTRSKLALWIADVATGEARPLLSPEEFTLNTVFDSHTWVDDTTLVVLTIPANHGLPPVRPAVPVGPTIQDNSSGEKVQARTYQDLLKDKFDESLFEHYATTQMVLVGNDGSARKIGDPKMYTSVLPSNDGEYLLVSQLERPFSFLVPCGRFPKRVEVWSPGDGRVVQQIAAVPLAENIPIAFNSVRQGRRSIGWRADKPHHLAWVETQDGGDARVEVSPRDILYSFPAEPAEGESPQVLHTMDNRFGGVYWGDSEMALVSESWWKSRSTRLWMISPGKPEVPAHKVFDYSYEDRYSDPGSPLSRRSKWGTYVLAKIQSPDGRLRLLLDGDGAAPEGDRPFLDLLDPVTGDKERIWQSESEEWYESMVALLCSGDNEEPIPLNSLRMIMSRESKTANPQYFIKRWPERPLTQVTRFPHPYPSLVGLSKEIIKYERADGVQLSATLFLPPGYDAERDGPLPMVMWAYPREFKTKDAAGQMRGSPNQFPGIGATSEKLFLALGYAVLSGPSMPIIGEGEEEANDTFVTQLVTSAQAAVDEVVRRGVADRNRIAIGGHSYGAFMTANLLAHAPNLFCCGVAESGAYNRTFTPFGFQSEERSLWEASGVYMEMSPFMKAHQIRDPLLLIHGEQDNNAGTFPMQSERFYAALKGHGVQCRLVILPHEGHGYRARESILHKLSEICDWLDTHCKNKKVLEVSGEKSAESAKLVSAL